MNNATTQAALAAVKPSIDATLQLINEQLASFFAQPTEQAVATVVAEVESLAGLFKQHDNQGLAVYCLALAQNVHELAAHPEQLTSPHREIFAEAVHALHEHLNQIMAGAANSPLQLFPVYQKLQQLRGINSAFEQDLFFPNTQIDLPESVLCEPIVADIVAQLRAARSQYQQALLHYLRQSDQHIALAEMQQAAGKIMAALPANSARAYWWVAQGFFDCLLANEPCEGLDVPRLLGRIDQQMRALFEARTFDEQPALNQMLYVLARASHTPLSTEIQHAYDLSAYFSAQATPSALADDVELLEIFLEEAHEVLAILQENWQLSQQHPDEPRYLETMRHGFATLKVSARMVGLLTLGEVAWNVERAMAVWLKDVRTVTPQLSALLVRALAEFTHWVEQLQQHGRVNLVADELNQLAAQLENPHALIAAPATVSADNAAPQSASQLVNDAELPTSENQELAILESFLDEASEVLQNVQILLAQARAQPYERAFFASIASCFATLKVRGRLVGLNKLGEVAWNVERALDAWLKQAEGDNVLALEMLTLAIKDFGGWIASIKEQGVARIVAHDLNQLAAQLENAGAALTSELVQATALDDLAVVETQQNLAQPVEAEAVLPVSTNMLTQMLNDVNEMSGAHARVEAELSALKQGLLLLGNSVTRLDKHVRTVENAAENQADTTRIEPAVSLPELAQLLNASVEEMQTLQQVLLKNLDETSAAVTVQARSQQALQTHLMSGGTE